MEKKRHIIFRFVLIFGVIMMGFTAVIIQILVVQYKEGDQWRQIAQKQIPSKRPIPPLRGNIYDCQGRLLVGSLPRYTLIMDTRVDALHQNGDTAFYNNVDSISAGLSRIFKDKSAGEYRNMLVRAFRKQDGRLKLQPNPVSYTDKRAVESLPFFKRGRYKSGLIIEDSHKRVMPFGSLAKRTLGSIYGETGQGIAGLEKQFNEELKGEPGIKQRQRIGAGNTDVVLKKAVNGCDLHTTIDADIQDQVESVLRQRLEMIEGEWGCCILMEVKTGKIRAISNLDRTKDGEYVETMNHAVTRVEPGSTFKTISLMAALDDGKIDYHKDSIEVYRAGWQYSDTRIYDAHPRDTIYCIRDAMAASSNIALAKIVTQAYEKKGSKFADRLERMGIADSLPCEIPGAQKPIISRPNDNTTLAKMSYGYSVELSPLQMLTIYNGIANNGKMISPIIVESISKEGKTVEQFESKVLNSSLCKSSTLAAIQECLHAVVWDNKLGTASQDPWKQKKAQSNYVKIAGKTGTAQIFENGRYSNRHHRIAFVGYFPEDNPQYSCICVMHHPHKYGCYDAGGDCGRVVRQIAERTMASMSTTDSEEIEQPYDSITKPQIKGGQQSRIKDAAKGTKVQVTKVDSEWAKVDKTMQSVGVKVNRDQVPNVIGMGARDAVYAIEQTGMKVQLTGKGRVASQSVAAGATAQKGKMVYLELR